MSFATSTGRPAATRGRGSRGVFAGGAGSACRGMSAAGRRLSAPGCRLSVAVALAVAGLGVGAGTSRGQAAKFDVVEAVLAAAAPAAPAQATPDERDRAIDEVVAAFDAFRASAGTADQPAAMQRAVTAMAAMERLSPGVINGLVSRSAEFSRSGADAQAGVVAPVRDRAGNGADADTDAAAGRTGGATSDDIGSAPSSAAPAPPDAQAQVFNMMTVLGKAAIDGAFQSGGAAASVVPQAAAPSADQLALQRELLNRLMASAQQPQGIRRPPAGRPIQDATGGTRNPPGTSRISPQTPPPESTAPRPTPRPVRGGSADGGGGSSQRPGKSPPSAGQPKAPASGLSIPAQPKPEGGKATPPPKRPTPPPPAERKPKASPPPKQRPADLPGLLDAVTQVKPAPKDKDEDKEKDKAERPPKSKKSSHGKGKDKEND